MSEVSNNGERKRRLPLWMSGIPVADPKSGKKDDTVSSSASQPSSQAPKKRKAIPKRVDKEVGFSEGDALEVDSSLVIKRDKGKLLRKSKRDLDHDDSCNGEGGSQNKRVKRRGTGSERSVEKCPLLKKKNAKTKGCGSRDVTEAPTASEEEEELTVKDLISIAEEYVKADRLKGATTGPESAQHPASFDFCRNESENFAEAAQSSSDFLADATVRPSLDVTTTGLKSQDNCASYGITSSPNHIGDSTQHMLDLLLGPLLKTSQTQERKVEPFKEDITMEHKLRKHSGNEILDDKVVLLMKKKSSLKDKVSMFF